ncbi:MAG: nitroreductase/quinone reductase family protein [Acidimicrobiia bacterium]|nr:nitroreductase/quinone reductase family protein [Acidimicrobiia bacterium]MDH5616596.1 nitroreductase/quinone reductase family protein [Acidimicrobiia bacterium]
MDEDVRKALEHGGVVDITTTGRTSGLARRIEIFFHEFDGDYFITGRPGRKRDWMANMVANPEFTLHLKRGVAADLPATATPITDPDERATILFRILTESWNTTPDQAMSDLPTWVDNAPLVRFSLV